MTFQPLPPGVGFAWFWFGVTDPAQILRRQIAIARWLADCLA